MQMRNDRILSPVEERLSRNAEPKVIGFIRPGIKVLTKKARESKEVMDLYNQGIAAGFRFSKIEQMIAEKTGIKHPMTPSNVPYFTVTKSDLPETAVQRIMEQHGSDRGDGFHLYRLPITLAGDEIRTVMPNRYIAYRALDGKHYRSRETDTGRVCVTLPDIVRDPKAARAKTMPPREFSAERGACVPGKCADYQNKKCKLEITLRFFIPGVPTSMPIGLKTSSLYAGEVIAEMVTSMMVRLPTLPRLVKGEPVFFLTKRQRMTKYIDDDGQEVSGLQWVPVVESDADMAVLDARCIDLLHGNMFGNLPAASVPAQSVALLQSSPQAMESTDFNRADAAIPHTVRVVEPAVSTTQATADAGANDQERTLVKHLRQDLQARCVASGKEPSQTGKFFSDRFQDEKWSTKTDLLQRAIREMIVFDQVSPLNIDMADYAVYADAHFGHWHDGAGFNEVCREIADGLEADEGIYASAVKAHIEEIHAH